MNDQLEIPEGISGTELETLYSKGEIAALPKNKKLNYISYIMSRNDELNSRAEQIADAREEGFAEGKAELIRSMHANGIPIEDICQIANMNIKDIRDIIS